MKTMKSFKSFNAYSVIYRKESGFTLIEVMVALAIFAVAASMLMLSGGNSIRQTSYMQEKILSAQVADQYLNKLYVDQRWPEKGTRGRVQVYAGYDWYVREVVRETKVQDFRQIVTEVFPGAMRPDKNKMPLASLTSYLRRPKK
ncbi:type II secretion system minor pseudopilin GspI [Endozoicomonas sp. Mp262]|uniref:type II secretion system minor pseudopilin GspI n=1 Tax=Endozoicomonas sp. Mp262 TaxID=2919499 RepID=UPI0021D80F95